MSQPTLILVHGAFHGAWCWRHVGEELTARGVNWVALDLPSATLGAPAATYLEDDARAVAEVARDEGPVILVGHSYGGTVITEASGLVAELRGLIYVSALIPLEGQSSSDAARGGSSRTKLDNALRLEGEYLVVDPELAHDALYNTCGPREAEWAISQLSTQTVASLRSPCTTTGPTVATRYIRCRRDQAISLEVQDLMAERCEEVETLDTDHSPFLSSPVALTELLLA